LVTLFLTRGEKMSWVQEFMEKISNIFHSKDKKSEFNFSPTEYNESKMDDNIDDLCLGKDVIVEDKPKKKKVSSKKKTKKIKKFDI